MGYRDYSTAKGHIVDASGHGDFTTIEDALSAASSGQTIFIRPGTYTPAGGTATLKSGVNIAAFQCDAQTPNVTIIGKLGFSSAGTVSISGIELKTNADFFLDVSGASLSMVNLINCFLNCVDNTGISFSSSNASSQINLINCNGNAPSNTTTYWNSSSPGTISVTSGFFNGTTTLASTNSAGIVAIYQSIIGIPLSCSGSGEIDAFNSVIDTHNTNSICITTAGTSVNTFKNSSFSSGTAASISIGAGTTVSLMNANINSSNANPLTGAGSLSYADITFSTSGSGINVATSTPATWKPFATSGTSVTAVRGTAGFDSTQFTVTNGFVQSIGGPGSYISLTPFIVGTDGFSGFATIASAITAAVGAGATTSTPMNVYIKPKADGTAYSENLTLQPGVNLVGFNQTVTISGKMTFTQAGTVNIQGLKLQTNSDFLLAVTGVANSIVNLDDCFLNCTNNTGISFTTTGASSQINLKGCKGDLGTTGIAIFAHSSAGNLFFTSCDFTNTGASSTANTASAGSLGIRRTAFENPLTTSGTVVCTSIFSQWDSQSTNSTCLTLGSAGAQVFHYIDLASGTASALSISSSAIFTHLNAGSSNVNAITGAGTIQYAFIAFTSSSGVNIVTATPLATLI